MEKLRPLKACNFSPCSAFIGDGGGTVTEPTTPVSFLRVVEARVCDATEARVSVALRVRSYSCPRHIDCNHFYQFWA